MGATAASIASASRAAAGPPDAAPAAAAPTTKRAALVAKFVQDARQRGVLSTEGATELTELLESAWTTAEQGRQTVIAFCQRHLRTRGMTVAKNRHNVAGANSSNVLNIVFCAGFLDGVDRAGEAVRPEALNCQQHFALRCSEADKLWRVAVDVEHDKGPRMSLVHGERCSHPMGGALNKVSTLLRTEAISSAAGASRPAQYSQLQRQVVSQSGIAASTASIGRALRARKEAEAQAGDRNVISYGLQLVEADRDTILELVIRDACGALGHGEEAVVRIVFHPRDGAGGGGAASARGGAGGGGGGGGSSGSGGGGGAVGGVRASSEHIVRAVAAAEAALSDPIARVEDVFKRFAFNVKESVVLTDENGNDIDDDLLAGLGSVLEGDDDGGGVSVGDAFDEEASDADGASGGASNNGASGAVDDASDGGASRGGASRGATSSAPARGAASSSSASAPVAPGGGDTRHADAGAAPFGALEARITATMHAIDVLRIGQRKGVILQLIALRVDTGAAVRLQRLPVVTSLGADFSYLRSRRLHDKLVMGIVAMSVNSTKLTFLARITVFAGNESEAAWSHLMSGVLVSPITSLYQACTRADGDYARAGGRGIVIWVDGEKGAHNAVQAAIDALPQEMRGLIEMGRCSKHIERNLRTNLGKDAFRSAFGDDAQRFWAIVDAPTEAQLNASLAEVRGASLAAYNMLLRLNNPTASPEGVGAHWARVWFVRKKLLTFRCRTSNLAEIWFSVLLVTGARTQSSYVGAIQCAIDSSYASVARIADAVKQTGDKLLWPEATHNYEEQDRLAREHDYDVEWVNATKGVARVRPAQVQVDEARVVDLREPHQCTCGGVDGVPCRHRLAAKAVGQHLRRTRRAGELSAEATGLIAAAIEAARTGDVAALARSVSAAGAACAARGVLPADAEALSNLILGVTRRALGEADVPLGALAAQPARVVQGRYDEFVYFDLCRSRQLFFWVHEFAVQHFLPHFLKGTFEIPAGSGELPSIEQYVDAPIDVELGVTVAVEAAVVTRGRPSLNARQEKRVCHRCGFKGHNSRSCQVEGSAYRHVRKRKRTMAREARANAAPAAGTAAGVAPAGGVAAAGTVPGAMPGAAATAGAVPGAVGAAAGVAAVALAPAPAAGRQRACQNCGVAGHYAKTCTQPCAVCGVQGHGKSSCPQQPSRSMGDAMV